MNVRQKVFLITALLYVSYMVFPMMADIMSLPIGVMNIITFGVLLITNLKAFFNKLSLWIILYLGVLVIYTLVGKQLPAMGIGDYESKRILLIESANVLPAFAIFQHLRLYNNDKVYKWITTTSLLLIGLSLLYIIPMAIGNEYLLRHNEVRGENHVFGMPSYALTHAYMLMIAGVLYGIRHHAIMKKVLLMLLLVLVLFTIYYSYVTTTFLISIGVIVLGLLYHKDKSKLIIRIMGIVILVVLVYASGLLESLLNLLVDVFDGTASQNKMIELRAMFMGQDIGGGVFENRQSLHSTSWKAFSNNVFFGSLPVGNHSSLIDRLGGLGLFGFVPFMFMLWNQMKSCYKSLGERESRFYYILSIGAVLVYMYSKGLFGGEGWLFLVVLIPSYIRTFQTVQVQN